MIILLFQITSHNCDILQAAINRYMGMQFLKTTKLSKGQKIIKNNSIIGTLDILNIHLANPCENYPSLNMDEKC